VSAYPESVPVLQEIYLEDSYVLDVTESAGELRFDLDAVLTEAHPRWTHPKPGEQYCYLRLSLVFAGPRRVDWLRRTMRPARDASGEVDYGNIDSLTRDGKVYELTGDWGHVLVDSEPPTVVEAE
jgi:hypothetical protein